MQTYIVSFALLLCLGITMRLIHPGSAVFSDPHIYTTAFLLAGAVLSLLYRCRVLAFILLICALCAAILGVPTDTAYNNSSIWIFAGLVGISIILSILKINGLILWMISAFFLGFMVAARRVDGRAPVITVNTQRKRTVKYGLSNPSLQMGD